MKKNIAVQESFKFAIHIIEVSKHLMKEQNEFILSKQLLKSGTSVGANIEEAQGGQSIRDFISKISIAYKETRESHYWIRLLRDSNLLDKKRAEDLLEDCEELIKILTSILKTTKLKLKNNS